MVMLLAAINAPCAIFGFSGMAGSNGWILKALFYGVTCLLLLAIVGHMTRKKA